MSWPEFRSLSGPFAAGYTADEEGDSVAEKTIFKQIIDREIPAKVVYEDPYCLAFEDINPQAPTHLIVIPKKEISTVDDVDEVDAQLIGHLFVAMRAIATNLGLKDGYRVVTNCGRDAGQEVMHIHFHMLAGRRFGWPPG
jgi:histidine triad (HIT) family protein